MNKSHTSPMPDENRIEELLDKIQPLPSGDFHKKMEQAQWRVEKTQSKAIVKMPRFKYAVTIFVTITITLLAVTPQGRAWAQEAFQFFRKVEFTSILLSAEEQELMNVPYGQYELPLVPVIVPTLASEMERLAECRQQGIQSYACQVAYAESKLEMNLKEFPKTPEGWIFKTIHFDSASKTASIIYTHYSEHGAEFTLRQGTGIFRNEYSLWSIVPADKIEKVKIGLFSGEYVFGGFTLSEGDNAWRWDEDFDVQRLAWSDGNRWYYIEIFPPRPGYISRDQLIEIANSLVDTPSEIADPLNPDSLSSIADAEKLSGLDLKAPTILPLGHEFSYARYFPFNNAVHLHYKYGEDLVIYEWQGTPDNFDALANIYKSHEFVNVNGVPAFYGTPKAVSQYESTYLFLAWHDENLNYRIYFYFDPSWGAGMLTRDKMIAIAESMGDVNDYKKNGNNTYEYVAIYEKALGFSIKEFAAQPNGWTFTDTGASPDCIYITYSATKENGEMLIQQCKTSNIPLETNYPGNAIETTNIGGQEGLYITGDFDYDKNGVLIWNPNSLTKRIRWQQDGLWIQIVISGDSTLIYNKEDLILLAERLE